MSASEHDLSNILLTDLQWEQLIVLTAEWHRVGGSQPSEPSACMDSKTAAEFDLLVRDMLMNACAFVIEKKFLVTTRRGTGYTFRREPSNPLLQGGSDWEAQLTASTDRMISLGVNRSRFSNNEVPEARVLRATRGQAKSLWRKQLTGATFWAIAQALRTAIRRLKPPKIRTKVLHRSRAAAGAGSLKKKGTRSDFTLSQLRDAHVTLQEVKDFLEELEVDFRLESKLLPALLLADEYRRDLWSRADLTAFEQLLVTRNGVRLVVLIDAIDAARGLSRVTPPNDVRRVVRPTMTQAEFGEIARPLGVKLTDPPAQSLKRIREAVFKILQSRMKSCDTLSQALRACRLPTEGDSE